MALLQASASANSQVVSSSGASPCSARNPRTARIAGRTSASSHASVRRKATPRRNLPADSDMASILDDFEDPMQTCQFEYLLHRWGSIAKPNRSAAFAGRVVDG